MSMQTPCSQKWVCRSLHAKMQNARCPRHLARKDFQGFNHNFSSQPTNGGLRSCLGCMLISVQLELRGLAPIISVKVRTLQARKPGCTSPRMYGKTVRAALKPMPELQLRG